MRTLVRHATRQACYRARQAAQQIVTHQATQPVLDSVIVTPMSLPGPPPGEPIRQQVPDGDNLDGSSPHADPDPRARARWAPAHPEGVSAGGPSAPSFGPS
jgi:hypothetical protein